MELLRRIGVRNIAGLTTWLGLEQALRMFFGLLIGILLARNLGPEEYGEIALVFVFFTIAQVMSRAGLETLVVRNHVVRREFWSVHAPALVIRLIFSVSIFTVAYLSYSLWNLSPKFLFILLTANILYSFELTDYYVQSTLSVRKYYSLKLFVLCIFGAIKVALLWLEFSLYLFFISWIFEAIFIAILSVPYYIKYFEFIALKNLVLDVKNLFNESKWLLTSGLVVILFMKSDQLLIKYMLGNYYVGLYSVAVRLVDVLNIFAITLSAAFYPWILSSKNGLVIYRQRQTILMRVLNLIALIVILIMFVCGEFGVRYLFGEEFASSVPVLKTLTLSIMPMYWLIASGKWYVSEGLGKLLFQRNLLGLVINLTLNIFLIPKYELIGAAVSTVVGILFSGLIFDLFKKETINQFYIKLLMNEDR